jgi:hypothetical protein
MTIQELNTKLGNVVKELQGGDMLGNIMMGIGWEARNMIYDRVTKTGINAEGAKYMPYSTKAMLVGCSSMNANVCNSFFGKEKNRNYKWVTLDKVSSQGKKIRLATLEGGYKKLRELHNRQTSFVDFLWSGQMWQGITLRKDRGELNRGIAVIGASDVAEKKLEGNTKRRGDILMLNQKEIDQLSVKFDDGLRKIIVKQGLA